MSFFQAKTAGKKNDASFGSEITSKVTLYLWTKATRNEVKEVKYHNSETLSAVDNSKNTIVLLHGWMNHAKADYNIKMKDGKYSY